MVPFFDSHCREFREALPWSTPAGYLVVIAESEELTKKLSRWKDGVQGKGVKMNMNKTKLVIKGKERKSIYKAPFWPRR